MAEVQEVNLRVNATEAEKVLAKFGGTLEKVHDEGAQPLNFAIGELEDRLYEMAAAGKAGTKEFQDMASEVGRMKKVIIDVDMQVDGLSMSFANKLAGTGQAVASGFELMQGAMGAFGSESVAVEEALLKVNSAMAMAQGIQGLKESASSFKALGLTAKNAFSNMSEGAKAFAVTGIGALVTAIAILIDNWETVEKSLGKVSVAQTGLNETMEDYKKGATDAVTATNSVETAFELAREGVISKEEALATYNETLGDAFGKTNDLSEAERLFNAKADAYIEAMAKRAQANALFAKSADETAKALTASQEDQRTTTDNLVTGALNAFGFFASAADKTVEQQKKRVKEAKKTAQENAKIYEDEAKNLLKSAEQVEKANGIKSESEQKLQKEIKKTTTVRKEAVKTELELFEEAQKKLLEDIASGTEYTIDKILPPPDEFADGLDEIVDITQEKFSLMEHAAMNWSENFQQSLNNTLNFTKEGLGVLGDLVEAFAGQSEASQRKAFKIKKAASIAQTLIETYQAAQSAYVSQVIPGDPTSVVRGAIAAAFATASGLARVKLITAQKFEGGGSSAGGGGSASPSLPASSPANFTIVGNSGTNQLAETLTNAPIQAYVVGGEVTTQQSLDRNKIDVATW